MAKKKSKVIKKKVIDPIYLSVYKSIYKENKVRLLQIQMRIINCAIRMENLKKLKKQKASLFSEMRALCKSIDSDFSRMDSSIPIITQKSEIRKATITQRISVEREINLVNAVSTTSISGLDKELMEIQNKLNNLGAYPEQF